MGSRGFSSTSSVAPPGSGRRCGPRASRENAAGGGDRRIDSGSPGREGTRGPLPAREHPAEFLAVRRRCRILPRQVSQDRRALDPQEAARGAEDRLRRDLLELPDELIGQAVVPQGLVVGEIGGEARHVALREVVLAFHGAARLEDLPRPRPLGPDPFQDSQDRGRRLAEPRGIQLRADGEGPQIGEDLRARADPLHQAAVLLHFLEQAAAPPLSQNRGQDPRRKIVRMEEGHGAEAHEEMGPLDLAGQDPEPEIFLDRLGRRSPDAPFPGGHGAQAAPGLLHDPPGLHVPHHRENHVAGGVVPPVEVQELLAGESAQRVLMPDPPAPDPVDAEGEVVELLGGERARVVHLPARLLDDGLQLPGQLLRIQQGVGQRVGLDLQPPGEGLGGEGEVVVGGIVVSPGVELAAQGLDLRGDPVGGGAAVGSLEEHVLDDVGDPDLVVLLVEVARLHPDVHGHDGRGVDLLHQDGEAVGEFFPDDVVGQTAPDGVFHEVSGSRDALGKPGLLWRIKMAAASLAHRPNLHPAPRSSSRRPPPCKPYCILWVSNRRTLGMR